MHVAAPSRCRTLIALLLATPLLSGCAAGGAGSSPAVDVAAAPRASAPAAAPVVPLGFELAPDETLQALIDPRPNPSGLVWLGGDVAASIEVSRRRFVWLFGDTLIGTLVDRCRRGDAACRPTRIATEADVVPNSAGVMELAPGGRPRPVVKYWRSGVGGTPSPILEAAEPDELLWPLAGARVGAKLLLAVNRQSREAGLFPLGNLFVLVHNPSDRPDRWTYAVHPVPNVRAGVDETDPLTWTTALVPEGEHLYVVGMRGAGLEARTVLARLRLDAIGTPGWEPHPEYLLAGDGRGDGDPVWSEQFARGALYELADLPGTSEASFEWRDDLGWVTFQIPPFGFHIRAYTAPALAGPWSDRGVVYRIPPPWSTDLRTDCLSPELACGWERFAAYAAKSHPELAPPGGFAVSYNVNVLFGSLETATRAARDFDGFYVPRMIAGGPYPH